MKFKFLSGLSLICALFPAIAEQKIMPQSAYILPNAQKSVLTDIISVQGKFFMAAGERGHLLKSVNGQDWQQSATPLQSNLNSVFFLNEQLGWAVGHDASIVHSNDGGLTWSLQQFAPELDKPLFDVVFNDAQNGIAVGAYGMFYRTTDGGKQWQSEFHPELASIEDQALLAELKESDPEAYAIEASSVLPHFNRLFADGNVLFMVGEAGFYASSHDFGRTWQRENSFYNGSLFGITRTGQGNLFAIGLRGHAFRSTDLGVTWQKIDLPSPSTLNSVLAVEDKVFLFGNAGTLLMSSDDGVSFKAIKAPDGKSILNGVLVGPQLVLATETGIKSVQAVVAE